MCICAHGDTMIVDHNNGIKNEGTESFYKVNTLGSGFHGMKNNYLVLSRWSVVYILICSVSRVDNFSLTLR